MQRISRTTWERHFRQRDISAVALVLVLAITIVAIVSLVLF